MKGSGTTNGRILRSITDFSNGAAIKIKRNVLIIRLHFSAQLLDKIVILQGHQIGHRVILLRLSGSIFTLVRNMLNQLYF